MSNVASFKTLLWSGESATVLVRTHTHTLSLSSGGDQIVRSSVIFRDDLYCWIINLQWCLRSGLRFFLESDYSSIPIFDQSQKKTLLGCHCNQNTHACHFDPLKLFWNSIVLIMYDSHLRVAQQCSLNQLEAVRVGFWHPITFKCYWSWAVGASKTMPLSEPCPRTSQLARVPSGSCVYGNG